MSEVQDEKKNKQEGDLASTDSNEPEEQVQVEEVDSEGDMPAGESRFFLTSLQEQSPELRSYMEDMMDNPFNCYCLSCKTQYSTHAVLWLGAYVC